MISCVHLGAEEKSRQVQLFNGVLEQGAQFSNTVLQVQAPNC